MYWDATNKACKQCFLSMCGELGEGREGRGEGRREGEGGKGESTAIEEGQNCGGEGRQAGYTYRAMFISTGSKVSAKTRSTVPFWVIQDCS